jgi:hypothetical protein
VEVEVSDEGAIVRVNPVSAAPEAPAGAPASAAVLLDLSGLERPVVGLSFDLGPEPREFVTPLRVEVSDDLVRFRSVPAHAALARLDQGGNRIERSDVEFGPVKARYVLVSAAGRPLPVAILAARVRPAPTRAAPPRHDTNAAGARICIRDWVPPRSGISPRRMRCWKLRAAPYGNSIGTRLRTTPRKPFSILIF